MVLSSESINIPREEISASFCNTARYRKPCWEVFYLKASGEFTFLITSLNITLDEIAVNVKNNKDVDSYN